MIRYTRIIAAFIFPLVALAEPLQEVQVQAVPIDYAQATENQPQEHQPPQHYSKSTPKTEQLQIEQQSERQHSHENSWPEPRPESTDQPSSERILTISPSTSGSTHL